MSNYFSLILTAIYFGASCKVFADGHHLRNGILEPSVGIMSEEVVLEKFKSYGIEVTKLDRKDNKFLVHTLIKSQPTVFELESSTGAVKLDGESLYLKPTADAFAPLIEPDLKRVPWNERTIRFEKMSIEGIRFPARPIQR